MSFSVAQDAKSELRTWTAVNGKEIEAEFVSNEKGVVKLKLKSGKVFEVPLDKLSKADQGFITAKASPANPAKEKPVAEIKPPAISNELLTAVKKGDEEAVKRQLADGADIAGRDKDGATVLHHAALKGHHEIIKILLKAGGNVNAQVGRKGNTPLHMAIFGGAKKDALLALLEGGANVNAQGNLKWTPLDAVEYGRSRSSSWKDETIALLRKRGGKTKKEMQGIFLHQIKGGTLEYQIKGDAITITDCDTGASGALTIPATFKGNPVTSIGKNAFYSCEGLTSITIADSVTSIEEHAFWQCTSLTSITIPDSVTSIGDWTFSNCSSLSSITIGDGVTRIWNNTFFGCKILTAVTFLGDAPKEGKKDSIFDGATFASAPPTIYRKPDAKGWGKTWGKRPVKLISEKP